MSENEIDLTKDTQQNDRRLRTRITNRASLISPRLNSPIAFNRLNNPSSLNPLQHVSSIQNSLSAKSSTKKNKQTKKKKEKIRLNETNSDQSEGLYDDDDETDNEDEMEPEDSNIKVQKPKVPPVSNMAVYLREEFDKDAKKWKDVYKCQIGDCNMVKLFLLKNVLILFMTLMNVAFLDFFVTLFARGFPLINEKKRAKIYFKRLKLKNATFIRVIKFHCFARRKYPWPTQKFNLSRSSF